MTCFNGSGRLEAALPTVSLGRSAMVEEFLLRDYGRRTLRELIVDMLYACFGRVPKGRVPNFLFPITRPEIHQLLLSLTSVKIGGGRIEIRVLV